MKTKTPPYGERRRLALDFDLSTQFDNPVWRKNIKIDLVHAAHYVAAASTACRADANTTGVCRINDSCDIKKEVSIIRQLNPSEPAAVENFFHVWRFSPTITCHHAPESGRQLLRYYRQDIMDIWRVFGTQS
ncbi:hypothetical protein ACLB1S_31025 [Escherichia coli]